MMLSSHRLWLFDHAVDGRIPAPVEVGSLPHYLQGFIHPRWLAGLLPSKVSLEQSNERGE